MEHLEQQLASSPIIKEIQESQRKLERDYETLYNLWKMQNDNLREFKDDIKSDMADLKNDIREDIAGFAKQHEEEVKIAREKWPKRAHLAFEGLLAAVALLEYTSHLHGW